MNQQLPKTDVVLLGAGHTHAHVLRMWRMAPIPDARLTLVSDFPMATYSGMLPGTLAGLYEPDAMQIDLVRLCAAAGARLVVGQVQRIDVGEKRLHFAERPALRFDVLSIGIGSVPKHDDVELDDSVVLVKPMQTFLSRLDERLQAIAATAEHTLRVAIVGGGAGGIEIAFCLPPHVRRLLPEQQLEVTLIDSNASLANGLPKRTARRVQRELARRGVCVLLNRQVCRVADGQIEFADGATEPADLVIWATGAAAPPLLAHTGLSTDDQGFLLTGRTLRSVDDVPIFAVGDSGSIRHDRTPKAGVYAVRQGPILWGNLHRAVFGRPLIEYRPQRGFLSLLATGDRRAILSYQGLTAFGGWCWRIKDRIDSRFIEKYHDYSPMPPRSEQPDAEQPPAMRCLGCGGKIGGRVLGKVLKRLEIPSSPRVLVGLDQPDDAALLKPPADGALAATVDFFTAFVDDPYLVGRVAALNAASDLFAMGSRPWGALAIATLPIGPESQQEELLYEMLAGGQRELAAMDAALVGGHTIEAATATLGYAMLADAGSKPPRTKSRLRVGDCLVLTKPLGSGILLAAQQRADCRAAWYGSLVQSLLTSNQTAALVADSFDVAAMTDVTGFGLAGHLLEMLVASGASAEVQLAAIPLLPGAEQLVRQGVESTLAPANRHTEQAIDVSPLSRQQAAYAALFDPQTSGGLLMAAAESEAAQLVDRLQQHGQGGWVIGRVVENWAEGPRLRLA
jgi:selenide,water dikinase